MYKVLVLLAESIFRLVLIRPLGRMMVNRVTHLLVDKACPEWTVSVPSPTYYNMPWLRIAP